MESQGGLKSKRGKDRSKSSSMERGSKISAMDQSTPLSAGDEHLNPVSGRGPRGEVNGVMSDSPSLSSLSSLSNE